MIEIGSFQFPLCTPLIQNNENVIGEGEERIVFLIRPTKISINNICKRRYPDLRVIVYQNSALTKIMFFGLHNPAFEENNVSDLKKNGKRHADKSSCGTIPFINVVIQPF